MQVSQKPVFNNSSKIAFKGGLNENAKKEIDSLVRLIGTRQQAVECTDELVTTCIGDSKNFKMDYLEESLRKLAQKFGDCVPDHLYKKANKAFQAKLEPDYSILNKIHASILCDRMGIKWLKK